MYTILLLILVYASCLYAQIDQHIFREPSKTGLLSPFTYEWTHVLEQFHNTLGHKNTSKDDSACLFPVPSFDCEPFLWNDAIVERDAYHLRPSVKKIFMIVYHIRK